MLLLLILSLDAYAICLVIPKKRLIVSKKRQKTQLQIPWDSKYLVYNLKMQRDKLKRNYIELKHIILLHKTFYIIVFYYLLLRVLSQYV